MSNSRSTWLRVKTLTKRDYASVFLAVHKNINAPIVVKRVELKNSRYLSNENKIFPYFINCPEIVKFYGHEITVEDGVQFYNLFLEYAPAGDLLDLMKSAGGRIRPESTIRTYTRMMLKGLDSIHAKGVVHCDIKLENILVFPSEDGQYRLKIADFGLAKEPDEAASESKKHRFRGTLSYMSPESLVLGEIGPAMDIWSLGCLVLEMFTGKYAWHGKLNDEALDWLTMMQHLGSWGMIPEIPEDMSEIGKDFLGKCLQRNPSKRWSVQELLDHPYVNVNSCFHQN